MISRYLFVSLYFLASFLLNRLNDFYHNSSPFSPSKSFPTNQLTIKQLQYILNVRGISYVHINEKHDLIQLVEQTGSVREKEFFEPIEDSSKRRTMIFSSYKQLLDLVDDCKETIWFVHLLPDQQRRETLVHLTAEKWLNIERRLAMFHFQTGLFNCSTADYSHVCRTLNHERFVLFVPSSNRRSSEMFFYEILSSKHYDYQYILKWLSKTLNQNWQKTFQFNKIPRENQSVIEFRIGTNPFTSLIPVSYFTLFYRFSSTIYFRLLVEEKENFHVEFFFRNSTKNRYVFNQWKKNDDLHEFYSFRSLNFFLSCLTVNLNSLMKIYFILLNISFLYDLYLIRSFSWLKKIFLINLISTFLWSMCFLCISTERIDSILQLIAFYAMKFSQSSKIFFFWRNDFYVYSLMSKWIFYSSMVFLHVALGLSFRWYLRAKLGRTTDEISDEITLIDRIHTLCSKLWQFFLCILFSEQRTYEPTDNTLLQYFSPDSLWLYPHSLLMSNVSIPTPISSPINFERLPIWRFTTRRRETSHGTREYYSDIELEQTIPPDDQLNSTKKSSIRRRPTHLLSIQSQENSYTSESDENNNSLKTTIEQFNSSDRYQCSICLEKYLNHVYICTLPCLHHFHRRCLFHWFSNSENRTCPLCRSPVLN